jgi:uncharacterized membrane protein
MEALLKEFASAIALATELACVLCIAVGALTAAARAGVATVQRRVSQRTVRRAIFVGFAGWIILALEFALAADIVRSAIAPTWQDIGQLAAIAAIRTALNWFLERDLEEVQQPAEPATA